MIKRASGVLLPIFSLPGKYGIGTFGKEAYNFADFLLETKQKYWQFLPLNPTSYGDSPYQSFSAFAINPYFIDLEMLIENGYLKEEDCVELAEPYSRKIDYGKEYYCRFKILYKAYENAKDELAEEVEKFRKKNRFWIEDYAQFMVLKNLHNGKGWYDWEEEYRLKNTKAMNKLKKEHKDEIDFYVYLQFFAFVQYAKLKGYINSLGIKVIGDIPIYVAFDSSDLWGKKDIFLLDENGNPTDVAGVPPDYFSKTGQLWGNPIYDYKKMEADGFNWWKQRVKKCAELYDVLRIDHFRGIQAYWAVPFKETTAINGKWVIGPGMKLIDAIKSSAKNLDVIAEDLGFLTEEVIELKNKAGFPGLAIYEFGYNLGDDKFENSYLAENVTENTVFYIGTHDNDTLNHFLEDEQNKELLPLIYKNLKCDNIKDARLRMLENLSLSKAVLSIYTMQDLLDEGGEYRFNTPSVASGNWQYRLPEDYASCASLLLALTEKGKR